MDAPSGSEGTPSHLARARSGASHFSFAYPDSLENTEIEVSILPEFAEFVLGVNIRRCCGSNHDVSAAGFGLRHSVANGNLAALTTTPRHHYLLSLESDTRRCRYGCVQRFVPQDATKTRAGISRVASEFAGLGRISRVCPNLWAAASKSSEKGQAPDKFIACRSKKGIAERRRPIFPYPVLVRKGRSDRSRAFPAL
jgi:hypothetical protein